MMVPVITRHPIFPHLEIVSHRRVIPSHVVYEGSNPLFSEGPLVGPFGPIEIVNPPRRRREAVVSYEHPLFPNGSFRFNRATGRMEREDLPQGFGPFGDDEVAEHGASRSKALPANKKRRKPRAVVRDSWPVSNLMEVESRAYSSEAAGGPEALEGPWNPFDPRAEIYDWKGCDRAEMEAERSAAVDECNRWMAEECPNGAGACNIISYGPPTCMIVTTRWCTTTEGPGAPGPGGPIAPGPTTTPPIDGGGADGGDTGDGGDTDGGDDGGDGEDDATYPADDCNKCLEAAGNDPCPCEETCQMSFPQCTPGTDSPTILRSSGPRRNGTVAADPFVAWGPFASPVRRW